MFLGTPFFWNHFEKTNWHRWPLLLLILHWPLCLKEQFFIQDSVGQAEIGWVIGFLLKNRSQACWRRVPPNVWTQRRYQCSSSYGTKHRRILRNVSTTWHQQRCSPWDGVSNSSQREHQSMQYSSSYEFWFNLLLVGIRSTSYAWSQSAFWWLVDTCRESSSKPWRWRPWKISSWSDDISTNRSFVTSWTNTNITLHNN